MREPLPASRRRLPDRVLAGPELHHVVPRVRLGPVDADGVEPLPAGEIEDHPLRMRGIVLAAEGLREVRVALPEGLRVAVGETRIADGIGAVIAGDAAARQRIAIGVEDRFRSRVSRADEVTTLTRAA